MLSEVDASAGQTNDVASARGSEQHLFDTARNRRSPSLQKFARHEPWKGNLYVVF